MRSEWGAGGDSEKGAPKGRARRPKRQGKGQA
jgi:hypothetical protein